MMCSRCGRMVPDGYTTCPYCGTPVAVQAPAPAAYTPAYQPAYVPPVPRHPVIETVRSVVISPLFLMALIAFSAALVLGVLSAGEGASVVFDAMSELYMDLDMGEFMPEATTAAYSIGSVIGGVFGSIPTILVAVGLWMVYASAKKNEPGISTGGMTLLWVMQVIGLVASCVLAGLALLVLLLVLLVGGLSVADMPDVETTIGLVVVAIVGVLLAGVLAFLIVYRVKLMKTVNVARQTLTTGVPSDKISTLVVVVCFITGGFSALSALGSLASLSVMTALSTAASAFSTILFGVVAIRYRDAMRQLMAPVPVAPPAPYAPAQPHVAPAYVPAPAPSAPYYDPNPTAELEPIKPQPEQPTEE